MQRKDHVVEDFHGTPVSDPYRYLENSSDPDTRAFVLRHTTRATEFLSQIPAREAFKSRLTELWNYPKYTVPQKAGGRYFYQHNSGLQNQAVLYVQEGTTGAPKALLDPNTFSEDGTIALTTFSASRCGELLAYARSASGSDWQEIRVVDIEGRKDYSEVLRHVKFTNMAWAPDGSGFFYSRFPDPATVNPGEESYHNKVYFHTLGTEQIADQLVYERPDFKELAFSVSVSEDGEYLLLHVWHGTDPVNRFYYKPLSGSREVVRLLDDADASYDFVGNEGTTFYFATNLGAPRGKIISVDLSNPARENWKVVVGEAQDSMDTARLINGQFVVTYLSHAQHEIKLFSLDGTPQGSVQLPTVGSVMAITGKAKDPEMFISFTSLLFPTTVYRYHFNTRELKEFWDSSSKFDPTAFEARQVFYTSKDGTRVPMFIAHKKGLTPNVKTPTLLYGYGGFNVSMTPGFSPGTILWLEHGGIYAQACLRGGAEYGEEWHRAGMLEKKQNVFDDFHAAAEYLISEGYTSSPHLSIMGGSNGGLLVAACMLQRPELYGAVICRVPVIDMLRYHKFTVGRYWVGEYGNAEANPEHFKFMYAYSPLHNVRDGVDCPPTLIMTADTDDRVVPAHAFKFMATLEEHYKGSNPILMRVEMKAGHGAGKPTSKVIEETADIYAFLSKIIG